jgi:hypothetical protein
MSAVSHSRACLLRCSALLMACGLVSSCVGPLPRVPALPATERLSLGTDVSDLTGTGEDAGFLAAVGHLLANDFLYEVLPPAPLSPTSGARAFGETPFVLRLGPNPFRRAPSGATPDIAIRVDLERAQYEPYDSAKDMINAGAGNGLLGGLFASLADRGEDAFVASVLYRCDLSSCNMDRPLLVNLVRGGDVRTVSRKVLFARLNEDASHAYLFRLAEALAAEKRITFPVHEYKGSSEDKLMKKLPDFTEPSTQRPRVDR